MVQLVNLNFLFDVIDNVLVDTGFTKRNIEMVHMLTKASDQMISAPLGSISRHFVRNFVSVKHRSLEHFPDIIERTVLAC
jgi:hypothetical protein